MEKVQFMKIGLYYRAKVEKSLGWMVTSSFRFSEHVLFDRCFDKEKSIFEFFVAPDLEEVFLDIAGALERRGVISDVQKLPNRLEGTQKV